MMCVCIALQNLQSKFVIQAVSILDLNSYSFLNNVFLESYFLLSQIISKLFLNQFTLF